MYKQICDYINENLDSDDRATALDFAAYLKEQEMEFIKDNGYWKDKIYYLIKFKNECVCFIAIKDPDEPNNRWTVWSDDMNSDSLGSYPVDDNLKETAWKHVDTCGSCSSCGGGRRKIIFGKVFDNVCGCTFRIDNPVSGDLPILKTIIEIRKNEILNK